MNNLLKALMINEEALFNDNSNNVLPDKVYEVKEPAKEHAIAKNIAMFVAAPFIALGFVIVLPLIGLYHFARLSVESYVKNYPAASRKLRKPAIALKNISLFFASPFIALGYVMALPFVGFFMIAKLAMEAHAKRRYINV